jgi:GNAT superfamily N-acetyltransferase/RimJ/RimL family protein N-acetyltransferase
MYTQIGQTKLNNGQNLTIALVQGPDTDWIERIVPFLSHKGEPWAWQIQQTLTAGIEPLEARYYIGLIDDSVAGNICTFTYRGTGILGHVFTSPSHRRKGVCAAIMTTLFEDFRAKNGRSLVLGTGYDSPAWHIYKRFGFEPMYPESGAMEWYAEDIDSFETDHFAPGAASVRPIDWRDWSGLSTLTCGRSGSKLRLVSLEVYNRYSMEHAFLDAYRRVLEGREVRGAAIESEATGATVGAALIMSDHRFPGTSILDLFVHPAFAERSSELLGALPANAKGGKIQAFAEPDDTAKVQALKEAGFREEAILRNQVKLDTGMADVVVLGR